MIIAPNSTVWLCSNVRLDPGYRNTKLYNSDAERFQEISSYSIHTVDKCSYIRDGRIRVTIPYSKAYKINYLIFKNTNFENKNFYAFVTHVRYVNNEVFEFTYQMDVFQTWWNAGISLNECFVEREHCNADEDDIYHNLQEEGLEFGDPVCTKMFQETESHKFKICIVTSFKMVETTESGESTISYADPEGDIYGKTYSGLQLNFFNDAAGANAFIKQAVKDSKSDGIISIMMVPNSFSKTAMLGSFAVFAYPYDYNGAPDPDSITEGTPFDGYVPKNKKLYQYPYRYMMITNGRGSSGIYRWEYSDVGTYLQFNMYMGGYNNPEIILTPAKYGNKVSASKPDPSNILTNGGGIPCSWVNDAYKAWLAQNQGQLQYLDTKRTLELARAVYNSGAGATYSPNAGATSSSTALMNPTDYPLSGLPSLTPQSNGGSWTVQGRESVAVNALIDWGDRVAQKMAILRDKSVMPPQSHVVTTAGQLAQDAGISGFTLMTYSIRGEYAKIIDEYFTCYGYICRRVKVPAIANRVNHNYVKTIGSNITGTAPADDIQLMNAAFDKGITIWHCQLNQIGDYSKPNGGVG